MSPFKMQERDLDLLILEELYADTGFADWLAAQIGIEGAAFLSAQHSVSAKANAKWGETDVLAFYEKAKIRIAVLIEDKISAQFADTQCQRYHERANRILNEGGAAEYKTVLVAPKAYISSVSKDDPWHCRLAIDDIADWFERRSGSHSIWRANALRSCVENTNRICAIKSEEVLIFAEEFSNFLKHNYPEFTHNVTGDNYGLSVKFRSLPKNTSIFWKFKQNLVDLELRGERRGRLNYLNDSAGLVVRLKPETDIFGIPVKSVSWGVPIADQLDVVSEVVAACQRLRSLALEIAALP